MGFVDDKKNPAGNFDPGLRMPCIDCEATYIPQNESSQANILVWPL